MHVPLALIFFSVLLLLAIFAAGLIGLSLLFLSGIIIASLTLAFVLGAVTGTVRRVLDRIKTRKYQTIVSEYEAPHRLEPAELGYLLDKRSTQAELIATFIAIAQKGTIRLTVDKHKNIHFVYTGNVSKPVTDIESSALAYLRHEKSVPWHKAGKGLKDSVGIASHIDKEIKTSLMGKGYVRRPGEQAISKFTFAVLAGYVTVPVIGIIYYIKRTAHSPHDAIDRFLTALIPASLFIILWSLWIQIFIWTYCKCANRIPNLTKKAHEHWRDIAGYRVFLKTVEFNRLDTEARIDNPVLPYCIALGYKLDPKRLQL